MSAPPPTLSIISDPVSLAKIQILLVPVQITGTPLTEPIYQYWSNLIKRHQILRGDEISRPNAHHGSSHTRGGAFPDNAKHRFFPSPSNTSISRATSSQHVHVCYPTHPPARHLYPLSLLRMAIFPLVVIGIALEPQDQARSSSSRSNGHSVQGYTIDSERDGEETGDIGEASTPIAPQFQDHASRSRDSPESAFHDTLSTLFPETSPFPLVRRLILVPAQLPSPKSARSSPTKAGSRSTPRPGGDIGKRRADGEVLKAPEDGVENWIGRIMGEVVGEVLGELGETAAALESSSGLKTLSSTLLPSLTFTPNHPQGDSNTPGTTEPLRTTTPISYLGTNGHASNASLSRSLTPGGRPVSVQSPSLPPLQAPPNPTASAPIPASSNPFRRSTAITSPFSRTSSAASVSSSPSISNSPSTTLLSGKYTSAPLSGVAGGRLMKLLGDMYLLAGLHGDAIKCFDDGAERCRNVGDVLWESAAREGRAVAGIAEAWEARDGSTLTQPFPASPIANEIQTHYLSALACLSRSPLPYPPTILSPSPQAASGSLTFAVPTSSHTAFVGTGEGLLAYLHTSLALRVAHFLLLIWAAGGWGSIALSSLLGHSFPRSFTLPATDATIQDPGMRRKRHRELSRLSSQSHLPRHEIFSHIEAALGPHHQAMTKTERLILHVEAAWMARWLDLPRKEAMITREVIKRIGKMVIEGREETRRVMNGGFRHNKTGSITGPTHMKAIDSGAVGLGLGMAVATPSSAVAVRRKESTEGNASIIKLFERVASIFGIDLLSFNGNIDARGSSLAATPPRFGWAELQVELMKEGIAIAEILPDHPTIIRLVLSTLHRLYPFLTPASQATLAKTFPVSLSTIRRRGIDIGKLPWWIPGRVVLSLEVASLPPNRLPRQHAASEIARTGKKDFFLYNPRTKSTDLGKTVIVANEQVDVFVTVQNPLAFDLEVADLSLITSGGPLITSPLPLIIPAASVQTVRVSALAPSAGTVQFRGVQLRLHDGSSTEVLLPIVDEVAKRKKDKRRSKVMAENGKVKFSGLDARFSIQNGKAVESEEAEGKWLECEVVEEQPLVWIRKTSLTHGTVMLYHGESSTIRLTLENSSSVPVDFIKLSFDDSTAREAQAIVAEGELSPEQAYELDWDQINRPSLVWENRGEMGIPPGGRVTLAIRCFGKVGCTDGSIRIDYGYINRPKQDLQDGASSPEAKFHTRQITFPILFTVYHTLEPHSLDLVRLLPSSSDRDRLPSSDGQQANPNDDLKRLLHEQSQLGSCLFELSVRNVYGVPFEVSLEREDSKGPVSTKRLVPPGATERLILPIPRVTLSSEIISKPIPSLSERQYVVDKSALSARQIAKQREVFWYREELLRTVRASWVEPGSLRCGTLNLRGQGLNPALLGVLKQDEIEVRVECHSRAQLQDGDRDGKDGEAGVGAVKAMDFVDLVTVVVNRLERPLRLLTTLEPLPSPDPNPTPLPSSTSSATSTNQQMRKPTYSPSSTKHLILDGSISHHLPLLNPTERSEHTVGACFLASGQFAFRAWVREVSWGGKGESPEPDIHGRGRVVFSQVVVVNVGP